VGFVLAVAAAVALSFAMNVAAEELRQEVKVASNEARDTPETAPVVWLAARVSDDLPAGDYAVRLTRADQLDHRADRIRELAGAASVAGLVLTLATSKAETRAAQSRSATSGAAKTTSNGMV
jgi:TRAP-type C4-dicarboxylate transport system substrate-binding protein